MPRQPKRTAILPVLEAFLERVANGEAEIPRTDDNRVNLVRLMPCLGLKENDRQYFYKYEEELMKPLDAVASSVGAAAPRSHQEDDAIEKRLAAQGSRNKDLEQENVELRARLRRVALERDALLERLRLIQETGRVFRARPLTEP